MSRRSTFYFAMPKSWEGLARLVDLGGTFDLYNHSDSGAEADRRALAEDWGAVWDDLRSAQDWHRAHHPGPSVRPLPGGKVTLRGTE